MQNNAFDDILKQKLSSLHSQGAAQGWDRLAQKMDQTPSADSAFDGAIHSKLSTFTTTGNTDWETFSHKLNSTQKSFDEQIADKLDHVSAGNVSDNWLLLHGKLQAIVELKRSIVKLKIFESVLAAALLITFVNIYDVVIPQPKQDFAAGTQMVEAEATTEILPAHEVAVISAIENKSSSAIATSSTQAANTTPPPVVHEKKKSNLRTPLAQAASVTPAADAIPKTQTLAIQKQINTIDPVAKVSPIKMELALSTNPINLDHGVDKDKKGRFNIHIASSFNTDLITTPPNNVLLDSEQQIHSYGSDVRLLASYDTKHFSVESGLTSTTIGYNPNLRETIEKDGAFSVIEFEQINYRTVGVPLTLKYHTDQTARTSLFVTAGLQARMKLHTDYIISNEVTNSVPSNPVNEDSEIFNSQFPVGITQGGLIKDNLFAYSHMGIGLQRQLLPGLSVYGQSTFSSQLSKNGFGPYSDHIDQLNFTLGLKLGL